VTPKTGVLPNSLAVMGGIRTKIRRPRNYVARLDPEGVKYKGFTYFPRHPGEVDPPYTPTKLFRVTRTKTPWGAPHWDKALLKQLGLDEESRAVAIVANTPSNNVVLYRIKHMIEIKPITFPHGMPTDPSQGFLKENGEYISYNKLDSPGINVEQGEKDIQELRRVNLDSDTLKIRLNLNWYSRW